MLIDNKKDRYPDDGYKIDPMQKTKRSVRVPLSALALSWFTGRANKAASQNVFAGLIVVFMANIIYN